jgi:hypothetical protein
MDVPTFLEAGHNGIRQGYDRHKPLLYYNSAGDNEVATGLMSNTKEVAFEITSREIHISKGIQ